MSQTSAWLAQAPQSPTAVKIKTHHAQEKAWKAAVRAWTHERLPGLVPVFSVENGDLKSSPLRFGALKLGRLVKLDGPAPDGLVWVRHVMSPMLVFATETVQKKRHKETILTSAGAALKASLDAALREADVSPPPPLGLIPPGHQVITFDGNPERPTVHSWPDTDLVLITGAPWMDEVLRQQDPTLQPISPEECALVKALADMQAQEVLHEEVAGLLKAPLLRFLHRVLSAAPDSPHDALDPVILLSPVLSQHDQGALKKGDPDLVETVRLLRVMTGLGLAWAHATARNLPAPLPVSADHPTIALMQRMGATFAFPSSALAVPCDTPVGTAT